MPFLNVILFGAPGSGKGTQSKMLASEFNLFHLSTGDLLREQKNDKSSKFFDHVNEKISRGELVSDDILFQIVSSKIHQIKIENKFNGIIFDGFPRNISQAKFLETQLNKTNNSVHIFNLNASFEVVIERILNRFTCANCGEVYNKLSKLPKNDNICDKCGAEKAFLDRSDDTPEIIKNRLEIFEENMEPIKHFYKENLIDIEASLPSDLVYKILKKYLKIQKV